jgi:hypothetical protein
MSAFSNCCYLLDAQPFCMPLDKIADPEPVDSGTIRTSEIIDICKRHGHSAMLAGKQQDEGIANTTVSSVEDD